jgi:hypothetical protein
MSDSLTTILVAVFASTGFWAVVNTIITAHQKKNNKEDEDSKLIKQALLALLHDAIYDKCTTILEIRAVSPDDYENIETMIKPYESLGGNGTVHKLWTEVQELPIYSERGENNAN